MFGCLIKNFAPAALLALCLPLSGAEIKEIPVTLNTQDGWDLSALYMPAQDGERTVVLLHDLGKTKESFASFNGALARAGFGYLAVDLRGYGQSTGKGVASSFAKEGVDNEFNKMTRDVLAALAFLKKKGVVDTNIAVLGVGLGANVAAKSVTFAPDMPMLALISPTANVRDVLTIPSLRVYKEGNVLIAAGAADKKMFLEASVIRNVAYVATGEDNGRVTFLTAYDLTSHEMLDKYLIPSVIQWLKTPHLPDVLPDEPLEPETENSDETAGGVFIGPSATEEALVPSVLE